METEKMLVPEIQYKTVEIMGQEIFYREAGKRGKPIVLLLHGFPTSSQMFRNLIPALADKYHVIAPDYVGYGNSSMPRVDEFEYTFAHMADMVEKFTEKMDLNSYTLYVMDYGAPIGYRLASKHPDRVDGIIVQNGNAYEEGLSDFWKPLKAYWADRSKENGDALRSLLTLEATKWQYVEGARNAEMINPDVWVLDQARLDRPGNQEIQLAMFYSYGSNVKEYPKWQRYFREHQPPMLLMWGKNDVIFPAEGAYPYKDDIKDLEFHLLDTGHFALEEDGDFIAERIRAFMDRNNR
ncbi:Haloalkane dehalogenase [Poriferisphaera corsica]|uniref:Haloalkane dehalogenase n=1 Tax=Poriferisphaera corsica TaxID=2528020 RepID=A0A517YPA7_9BACT|nr:alpha/beta hydrolase [Poriferisphaera corsica]QDU32049.1 Haloalkane dehalogenase [Poriferisphaera corsica]